MNFHEKYIVNPLRERFSKVGYFVADYPKRILYVTMAVSVICFLGLLLLVTENRSEKLWSDQSSTAWSNWQERKEYYGKPNRLETVLLLSDNGLLKTSLQQSLQVHNYIVNDIVAYDTKGTPFKLDAVCFRAYEGASCEYFSVHYLWNYNMTLLNSLSQEDIFLLVTANQQVLLGTLGTITYDEEGIVNGAEALQFSYTLFPPPTVDEEMSLKWEKKLLNFVLLKDNDSKYLLDPFKPYVFAARSTQDEIDAVMFSDITLFILAILLALFYTCLVLGKMPLKHKVESRLLLGCTSSATVLLSMIIAFGLSGYFGVLLTILSPMVVFILAGIGVDGMIIIADFFDTTDATLPIRERLSQTYYSSGPTLTLTSLTDFVAFMMGATINLLAIRHFCITAAFSVVALYFLQFTFFGACLVYDTERQHKRQLDCCYCYYENDEAASLNAKSSSKASDYGKKNSDNNNENINATIPLIKKEKNEEKRPILKTFIEERYVPFLFKPIVRIGVLLSFSALIGVSLYYATKVVKGMALPEQFTDSSYLGEYYLQTEKYFDLIPAPAEWILPFADYSSVEVQDKLSTVTSTLYSTPEIVGIVYFWYDVYSSWAISTNNSIKGDDFYKSLPLWMNDTESFIYFSNDLIFVDGGSEIEISRLRFTMQWRPSVDQRIDDQHAVESTFASIELKNSFVWTEFFIYNERDEILDEIAYRTVASTLLAIFVTLLLFLDPITSALVTFNVTCIDICLFGMMGWLEIQLDTGSFVCLVMAVGLSVDYVAHIGVSFMNQSGNRLERSQRALIEIGSGVFNGGFSTLVGVCALAFTNSEAFRVFFKMFFFIVLFGLMFGLILFPVQLSFIGKESLPPSSSSSSRSETVYGKDASESERLPLLKS